MIAIPERDSNPEHHQTSANDRRGPLEIEALEFEAVFLSMQNAEWLDVWQWMCQEPWFQRRLDWASQLVLRRTGCPRDWETDIKQQALLVLAANLRKKSDLGFDTARGRLGPFLSTVLYRCCQKAIRQFRGFHSASAVEEMPETYICSTDRQEALLDLHEVVDQLPNPWKETMQWLLDERSVSEIASHFDCSERTVYRRIERAMEMLRKKLE